MKKRVLYQTLEDRNNNKAVETNGPGYCRSDKAWLCKGFYFWEASIENAHWWGKRTYANYRVKKGYIICKTSYDYAADNFFDLVGDTTHRQDFWDAVEVVEKAYPGKTFTAAFVLAFMRKDSEFSNQYLAVRAYPSLSRKDLKHLLFEEGKPQFIEKEAPIQLCIWNDFKSFLTDPFTVIGNYPYRRQWISINK